MMVVAAAAATAAAAALRGRHAVFRHPAGTEFRPGCRGEPGEKTFRTGGVAFGAFRGGIGCGLEERLELMAALFA